MNSLEKLNQLLQGTSELEPENEEQARLMQMFQVAGPMLGNFIPESPEAFDDLLLGLTRWSLQLRSDDADPAPAVRTLAEGYAEIRERAGIASAPPLADVEPEA
jgi:hypothetical protein